MLVGDKHSSLFARSFINEEKKVLQYWHQVEDLDSESIEESTEATRDQSHKTFPTRK